MMQKRFLQLLFFLLLGNIFSTRAQNTWDKFYSDYDADLPNIDYAAIDIKYDSINSKYIFLGLSHGSWVSIYELSDNGNLLFRNYYHTILHSDGQTLRFTSDGGAIVSDYEVQGILSIKNLYKIDSLYNIVWKQQYNIRANIGCGLIETTDQQFALAWTITLADNHPLVSLVDTVGNLVLSKIYSSHGIVRTIKQTVDGNYLLAFNSEVGEGSILCKLDSSLGVLWSKSYFRQDGVIIDLIEKPNGNLLVAGNTGFTTQTPYPLLYLMELDSQGNVLWTKTYGDSTYRFVDFDDNHGWNFLPIKIKQTSDGGLILVTTMTNQGSNSDLVLLKTDQFGNIVWERRHGDGFFSDTGLDLIQAADSGYFVIGGFYRSPISAGYYLLKTDSLGSIGCSEYSDVVTQNNLLPTDSNLTITDSVVVLNQYLATVHDTTDYPADSVPGCIEVNVPENDLLSIDLVIFPNPTTGIFHLTFPADAIEAKDIFIYDLMGREVSATFGTRQTGFDFTLSVKGIYLVKVFYEGKTAVRKVVVM